MPVIPCASWKEWIWISFWCTISTNWSLILSSTSLFTSKVLIICFCVSCSASRARFDAISPQLASALPRCGVPRKTTSLVRLRHASDLYKAYSWLSMSSAIELKGSAPLSYVFNNDTTKAVGDEYDRILTLREIFDSGPPKSVKPTSLSISRSSRTLRSRPCCDTLFLLFAWNSPPITSALYPYVHTLASRMSFAR